MNPDRRKKLLYIIPYHIAWGCCTCFWVVYTLAIIITEERGLQYVGVVSTIDILISFITAYLSNKIAQKIGQFSIIIFGGLCMSTVGLVLLFTSNDAIAQNRRIIGYTLLHGLSRAIYESNMKAVIADVFPEHEAIAYSVTAFSKNIATATSYIAFALNSHRFTFILVVIITGLLSVISYICAYIVNANEKRAGYNALIADSYGRHLSVCSSTNSSSNLLYVPEYFW
jgi:MFS family permease